MKREDIWKAVKTITVEPILFLYVLIIFMESNALKEIVFTKACIKLHHPTNISDCNYENKQNLTLALSEATFWMKYYNVCLSFSTLVVSLFVASWSDYFGRKFPMVVPPLGTLVASCLNCILSLYLEAHIAFFFISAFISGITFGMVGIIAATFGFIADITDESNRTQRIVILESMLFIGGTMGIYLCGEILRHVDFHVFFNKFAQLFVFEMIVAAFVTFYTIFRIPRQVSNYEMLPQDFSCGNLFKLTHITDSLKTVFQARPGGKRKKILLMLLALIFIYFGLTVQLVLAYYFVKGEPLKWSLTEYSHYNSIQFGLEGAALLIGLPVAFHFFNIPDHFVGAIGALSRMAGFILFGLSTNRAMVYSCAAVFIFSEYAVPSLRSMLSKTVEETERGRIFAVTTILQNLVFLVGNWTLMSLFSVTSFFPGLCFEVVAVFQAIALIIFGYLYLTRDEYVTVYEVMENDDGSYTETVSVAPIN